MGASPSSGNLAHESGGVAQRLEHRLHKPVVADSCEVEVIHGLDILEYHAHPAPGSTDWKRFATSAIHGRPRQSVPAVSSAALNLGKLWHSLLDLSPEVFGERSVVGAAELFRADGSPSTKKDSKEWFDSLPADAIPISPDTSDQLGRMLDMFQQNAAAWDIYESREIQEVSVFWDLNGVRTKCRPDCISDGMLVDWKSTSEQAPLQTFGRAVKRYGYGLSAALYEEGCRVAGLSSSPMHFVVTSTVWPYETQVLTLPPSYTAQCREDLLDLVEDYKARHTDGNWLPKGYGEVNEISVWGHGAFADRVE
jgi:hypothetical protein